MLRKFLLLSIVTLACVALATSASDPRANYREIYSLIIGAEQSSNAGKYQPALEDYQKALARLQDLQVKHPDWEKDIVRFRIGYAQAQIKLLESKIEAEKNNQQWIAQLQREKEAQQASTPQPPTPESSFTQTNLPVATLSPSTQSLTPPPTPTVAQAPATPQANEWEKAYSTTPSLNSESNQIAALQSLYQALEERLVKLLDENRRLRSSLVIAENKGYAAEAQMVELQTRLGSLEKRVTDSQNIIEIAQQRTAQSELRASQLQTRLAETERTLMEAQAIAKLAAERTQDAERKAKELQDMMNTSQTATAELQLKATETERRAVLAQEALKVAEERAMQAERLVTDLQTRLADAERRALENDNRASIAEKRAQEAENRAAVSAGYAQMLQRSVEQMKEKTRSEVKAEEQRNLTLQQQIEHHRARMEEMARKIDEAIERPSPQQQRQISTQERALIDDLLTQPAE